jgi:hypothetical protein
MHGKPNWGLLAATVLATAIATLAVLEYLHRHPDCRLGRWWHSAQQTVSPTEPATPRLQLRAWQSSDSSPTAEPDSPPSIPPDILQQSLRELRLLDQFASGSAASEPAVASAPAVDEFCPEKIPVPPRCVLADADTPQERIAIPDGRTLAPVVSVETLPVAPKPVIPENAPDDLDDDTATQTEPADDTPGDPEQSEPAEETVPACRQSSASPTHKFSTGGARVVAVANGPCCTDVDIVVEVRNQLNNFLSWLCGWCQPSEDTCCRSTFHTRVSKSGDCCCRCEQAKKQTDCDTGDSPVKTHHPRNSEADQSGQNCSHRAASPPVQQNLLPPYPDIVAPALPTRASSPPVQPKLMLRIYPVADFVESAKDGYDLEALVAKLLHSQCCPDARLHYPCPICSPRDEEGWVAYHNGCRALVVMATCENHGRIAAFLSEMRKAARIKSELERARRCQEASESTRELPCPVGEPERVIVVPIVRPVLVPVAVPVPVGVPDTELPPPQFRVPDPGSEDEDGPECPARRFVLPTTPEQLPDCQGMPAEILPMLRQLFEQLRGAIPNVTPECPQYPKRNSCPSTLPVLPPDQEDSEDDCPPYDDEDLQPLETDLSPPIG